MLRSIPLLVLFSGGCIFVSQQEYDDRATALSDQDMDTHLSEAAGGDDCDDTNATVYPGAQDTWYDGVDSDCAGNDDYDMDGDGYASALFDGDDCDDQDAGMSPGATEIWYDGIDQDCAGDDDDDADGDGYQAESAGGEDCLDDDPNAWPGATETWYDGVDSDCAGDDDYDADGDGLPSAQYGGQDCDDGDPETGAEPETLGDDEDGDCDGLPDAFHFSVIDTHNATGIVGPRVDINAMELVVGWAAEFVPIGRGYNYEPVVASVFDPSDPRSGMQSDYWVGYENDAGTLEQAFDFTATEGYWTWTSSLTDGGFCKVEVNVVPPRGVLKSIVMTGANAGDWDDMQLHMDPGGAFTMVACGGTYHQLWLASGALAGIMDEDTDLYHTVKQGSSAWDSCEYRADEGLLQLGDSQDATLTSARDDEGALSLYEPLTDWTIEDMEYTAHNGHTAWAVSDLLAGLYLEVDGDGDFFETTDDLAVLDVSTSSDGTAYVCGVAENGHPWLLYGNVHTGLTEVALSPELGEDEAEDCALAVTAGNTVVVAVRGGDQLLVGYVDGL